MVICDLKTAFVKLSLKKYIYRDYKIFDRGKFQGQLETQITENSNVIMDVIFLKKTLLLILNKYVSFKTKIFRASHGPYITKTLRKTIMKHTVLKKLST